MKKLVAIFTLLFSTTTFISPAYAEWSSVAYNIEGDHYHIDFSRIRKHDGNIYYWELLDLLKPSRHGFLSALTYKQGNCSKFGFKILSEQYFKTAMATGVADLTYSTPEENWRYPTPGSVNELVLTEICDRVS